MWPVGTGGAASALVGTRLSGPLEVGSSSEIGEILQFATTNSCESSTSPGYKTTLESSLKAMRPLHAFSPLHQDDHRDPASLFSPLPEGIMSLQDCRRGGDGRRHRLRQEHSSPSLVSRAVHDLASPVQGWPALPDCALTGRFPVTSICRPPTCPEHLVRHLTGGAPTAASSPTTVSPGACTCALKLLSTHLPVWARSSHLVGTLKGADCASPLRVIRDSPRSAPAAVPPMA